MNQDVETLRMLAAWFDVVYPELTRDGRPLANTSDEIQQDLRRIADMLEQGFAAGPWTKIEEAPVIDDSGDFLLRSRGRNVRIMQRVQLSFQKDFFITHFARINPVQQGK